MKRVILESPYQGNRIRNIRYARACMKHSLAQGEAPLASHLLYTQPGILDDDKPEERALGINAGLAWLPQADLHVFYVDYGMSLGMFQAMKRSKELGRTTEARTILTEQKPTKTWPCFFYTMAASVFLIGLQGFLLDQPGPADDFMLPVAALLMIGGLIGIIIKLIIDKTKQHE